MKLKLDPFRLGYISSTPKSLLADVLSHVKVAFLYLQIQLFETSSQMQKEGLETGKLDLGIVRAPIYSKTLFIQRIMEDSFVAALPVNMPVPVNLADLAQETFISYHKDYAPVYHQNIIETCNRLGFSPEIAHECNTIQSILELVHWQTGVAIVPKSVAKAYQHLAINFVNLEDLGTKTEIVLAWDLKNQHLALPLFCKLIKNNFQA